MKKEWLFEEVSVECYAGYKGEEAPRAFVYRNQRYENLEVLDRWYQGGMDPTGLAHNYFKIKTSDGEIFLLRYTPRFESWTVCLPIPASHFPNN